MLPNKLAVQYLAFPLGTLTLLPCGRSNTNHHIHAFSDDAARKVGQAGDLHLRSVDIGQLSRLDVKDVVVRLGIRVIEHPGRINDHFAHQLFLAKQLQRVIDGRLRSLRMLFIDNRQDLIG